MFKTSLMESGNGIGRRLLLVVLSALLVIATLVIIPGNAYGDEDSSTTTSEPASPDTTVSDTTVPDTTIPEAPTTTVAAEPAPVTETTTTTSAVVEEEPVTVESTTATSAVVEEEPVPVTETTTTSIVVEELVAEPLATEDEPVAGLLAGTPPDFDKIDMDQCGNGQETVAGRHDPCIWQNGNLNANAAHLLEGYSVPYRMILTNIPAGVTDVMWVEIGYDIKHSSTHALDYITSYERFEPHFGFGHDAEAVNPLDDLGYDLPAGGPSTFPIPAPSSAGSPAPGQPTASFNALPAGDKLFTIYGGTITDMQYTSQGDLNIAKSETTIKIFFTPDPAGGTTVFAWGGHIAAAADWGEGNAAGGISGSPYHMRAEDTSVKNVGNLDMQLSAAAVFPVGTIIINKIATGGDDTFLYTGIGTNITGTFDLTTVGGTASQTFTDILADGAGNDGIYTITELLGADLPAGWSFTDLTCTEDELQNSTTAGEVATIHLDPNENVECTYTNVKATSLILAKDVVNDNGGTADAGDWLLIIDEGLGSEDIVTGSTGGVEITDQAGTYTLSESGPLAYTNTSIVCDNEPGVEVTEVTIALGETVKCTFVNDDDAPDLVLIKNVTNDNGGDAVAANWTLTATSTSTNGDFSLPANQDTSIDKLYGTTGPQHVFAHNEYTLTETGPDGYTQVGTWECVIVDALGVTGPTVDGDTITLNIGEFAACSVTNDDDPASLILAKTVINDNGGSAVAANWSLYINLGISGEQGVTGSTGGSQVTNQAGTYTLSELGPGALPLPGYTNTSLTCDNVEGEVTEVTIGLGETVKCTFVNDDDAPGLTLIKHVINDNGGDATADQWTLSAGANDVEGSEAGVLATDQIGTYALSETDVAGYTNTSITCDNDPGVAVTSVTVALGDTIACTFVNDDNAPSLTLIKHVINDNGGDATADQWTLSAGAHDVTGSEAGEVATDQTGTYALSETTLTGYTNTSITCDNVEGEVTEVTIVLGETVKCTFVNDDDPASLILAKTVINDNGGSAVAANWSLYINLGISGEQGVTGSTAGAEVTNKAGFYTLSELGPGALPLPGYTNTSVYCDNNPGSNVRAVTIHVGETITCTFVNDDDAPTLTLIKHVVNDDGGDATADQWTLSAGANDVTGSEAGVLATDQIGTYALSETALAGYTNTSITCDNDLGVEVTSVTVGLGDDIECTFVNDDVAPTLDLFKAVLNDHGGNALPPDWTLEATSTSGNGDFALPAGFFITFDVGATTPQDVFANNEYTLSETGESDHTDDYTQDGPWSCWVTDAAGVEGDKVLGDTITLDVGESAECVVVNDDDVAELTLVKHVVNDNGGTSVAADWTLKATSDSGNGDISALADQNTSADDLTGDTGVHEVHANNEYTLSETGTTDYTQTPDQWSCVIDGADPVLSNTITLAHGASAVCTAVNDDDAPSLILVKDVVNDNGGNAVASDWDLFIDEGAAGEKSVPGSVSGLKVTDQAGTYDLSESTLAGYKNTLITCDNLPDGVPPGAPVTTATVVVGETVTCTFTNDDVTPTLKLAKSVSNDNGGDNVAADWTLTATSTSTDGDFSLLADKNTSPDDLEGDTGTQDVYSNNEYTLTETGPDGYTQVGTWECVIMDATGTIGDPILGNTITLGEGEAAECGVINDDVTPTLKLSKSVSNDNGGDNVAADWTLTATSTSGDGDFSLLADKNTSPDDLEGDTGTQDVYSNNEYTLTETGPDGYTQVGTWECVIMDATGTIGDPILGNTITLGEGEAAECGVINDDDPAELILVKTVVNDNGGNGVSSDWTLSAGSNDVTGSETGEVATDQAGTYALSESVEPGYAQTSLTCSDDPGVEVTSVTIGLGETITCEFVNDDQTAGVDIEKSTNGHDADSPTGPYVPVGDAINWEYEVTNPGQIPLSNVVVTDDMGVTPVYQSGDTNTDDLLDPGETWIYTATGVAVAGQYANIGTVTAVVGGDAVLLGIVDAGIGDTITDTDPSHYFGVESAINIEKSTNGEDADTPTGPEVLLGDSVMWEYVVTNTGNTPLANVVVTDDQGVTPVYVSGDTNTDDLLDPTETWIYQATGVSVLGQYANIGTATGVDVTGATVTATDPSHYLGFGLASLGDTVWNDANSNGVQDNGEKGIAGALVKLTLPDGTTLNTTTDADGKYLFSGLIPGTYTVEIVMSSIPQPDEGELKLTTAGSFTVILAVGDNDLDSDFGVVAVLPVTGINTTDIARIAFALLLAGAFAVFLTTRKRRDEDNLAA